MNRIHDKDSKRYAKNLLKFINNRCYDANKTEIVNALLYVNTAFIIDKDVKKPYDQTLDSIIHGKEKQVVCENLDKFVTCFNLKF